MKKKRSLIKRILVCLFAIITFAQILPVNVYANEYESDRLGSITIQLNDIEITAVILEDGSIHIKEEWDIDVYEGTEIYKVFSHMGVSQISNFQVTDENGFRYQNIGEWDFDVDKEEKNGKCGIIQDDDYYELCFGIGEYGKREYTFEYDISSFVQQYQDAQGFNYAFFSEMELEPQHVKITVSSPFLFT